MNEFLTCLGLVCVLPFVFAMLELRFKESKRTQTVNRSNVAGIAGPGLIISFSAEQRGHELVRVAHATALTARWSDRGSFWARSEGDAFLKELALHEIGLPSASIGKKTRRSVVLKARPRPHHERLHRSAWSSLN
jgi:hypothetical protein